MRSSLSEIQITYKNHTPTDKRVSVRSSEDAFRAFIGCYDKDQLEYKESMWCMYLNRQNQILGMVEHSKGGCSGTIMDLKQILAIACTANASAIILSHNHPSGNLRPSAAHIEITKKMKTVCALMDLECLDHLIVTEQSFTSLADEGLI